MDGRIKPPKPKKRPRPVNPRYQPPAAPVSADGPMPLNPFLIRGASPPQPTATERALGIDPQNPFQMPAPPQPRATATETALGLKPQNPFKAVLPSSNALAAKKPGATRKILGSVAGGALQALGEAFAPTEEVQPAPQMTFAPVTPTPPRPTFNYDDYDILFKRPVQRPIFRKNGGRVKPGQRYIVGEEGPEELILDTPGRVIANKEIDDPAIKAQIQTLGGTTQQPVAEVPINGLSIDAREDDSTAPTPTPTMPAIPAVRPQNPFLARPAVTPQHPTETEAALGIKPQNPFYAVNPMSGEPYGQPAAMTGGSAIARPMPVNPMAVQTPQTPPMTPPVQGDTSGGAARPVNPALGMRPIDKVREEIRNRASRDYRGKRDEEHPYRAKGRGIKNTLKAAGIAFLQAFAANAGLPLNQRIMASLGGAAAGGIGGTVNPNLAGQMMNQAKLQQLYSQYEKLSGVEDAELNRSYKQEQIEGMGARARQAEKRSEQAERRLGLAEKKAAESQYNNGFRQVIQKLQFGYRKGANPVLDEELARYGMDIQQWDTNRRTFWQGQNLMTFDENNEAVPVTDAKGQAVTDVTRKPVTVTYDGQEFVVPQTVAFQGLTNAGSRNTNIQNQDIKDENDRIEQLGIAKAELSGIDTQIGGLDNDIKDLQAQLDKLDPANVYGDAQKATSIQSQIQQHKSRRITLAGERTKLAGKVKTLSEKPKPRNPGSVPKVSVSVSEDEFKKALQAKGIPQTEWMWRIADAKRNGVIR